MNLNKILYLVATPIGNLSDISERGIKTLKAVDIIFAEDTRVTAKLLNNFEIKKQLISYHKHNEAKLVSEFNFSNVNSIALVSDAGMPVISDPGKRLVEHLSNIGWTISTIPGPSAITTIIPASGIGIENGFSFIGFFPKKENEISNLLNHHKLPIIFFESPNRIRKTISFIKKYKPNSRICIGRELTKIFEEFIKGNVNDINVEDIKEKGEFVVMVNINHHKEFTKEETDLYISINNSLPRKELLKEIQNEFNISRNEAYKILEENKKHEQ